MLMTWIEILVLTCAFGGLAALALPRPWRVGVRMSGRFIPGRRAAQLERVRLVRYAAAVAVLCQMVFDFP